MTVQDDRINSFKNEINNLKNEILDLQYNLDHIETLYCTLFKDTRNLYKEHNDMYEILHDHESLKKYKEYTKRQNVSIHRLSVTHFNDLKRLKEMYEDINF